jgi:LysM repeat protein
MDTIETRRKRANRARERYQERQQKRKMVTRGEEHDLAEIARRFSAPVDTSTLKGRIQLLLRDAWWYTTTKPYVLRGLVGVGLFLFFVFVFTHLLTGRIFPNVWTLGVHLGDLTVEEAAVVLNDAWENQIVIQLVDGDRSWSASPSELGLQLDAAQTAALARGAGMAGIPFGYGITPVINVDYLTIQNYLLDMTAKVEVPPFNAGYEWRGEELVGVPGRNGKMLDVALTMETLLQTPEKVAETRRVDLIMTPLTPDVIDPDDFLDEARAVVNLPFQFTGYDPFTDKYLQWSTTREVLTSWLEAGNGQLTIREDAFIPFLDAQNASLDPGTGRYLDTNETIETLQKAIVDKNPSVFLRIRYRPTTYEVMAGDRGYSIARKTGIPYYLIAQANQGRNMDQLSVGDRLNIPSRDVTLPIQPVLNKRIVVNLDTQSLIAYENGQPVFSWEISSGMAEAPTYPGVYQILSHNDVASGSSYTLCSQSGCGEWEMYWFMGIYEVTPGLMNGFHGAVLLPNGAYLGGGNVGAPYTFGCVMSENSNAEKLYQWADIGTIVEIVSSEYQPQSDLARLALSSM